MDDLISRQRALDHLRKRLIQTANNNVGFVCDAGSTFEDASERVKTWLDEVPPVDAVPVKRGVWVTYTDGMMHCSNCSKIPINRIYALSRLVYDVDIGSMMKYCPHCGARMDGEE